MYRLTVILIIFLLLFIRCESNKENEFSLFDFQNIKSELRSKHKINLDQISSKIEEALKNEKCKVDEKWSLNCNCHDELQNIVQLNNTEEVDTVLIDIIELVFNNVKRLSKDDSNEMSKLKKRLKTLSLNYFYAYGVFRGSGPDRFAYLTLEGPKLSEEEIFYILSMKCIIRKLGTVSYNKYTKKYPIHEPLKSNSLKQYAYPSPILIDTGAFWNEEESYEDRNYHVNAYSKVDTASVEYYKSWSDSILNALGGGRRSMLLFFDDKENTPKIPVTMWFNDENYEKHCFLLIKYKLDTVEYQWNPFEKKKAFR